MSTRVSGARRALCRHCRRKNPSGVWEETSMYHNNLTRGRERERSSLHKCPLYLASVWCLEEPCALPSFRAKIFEDTLTTTLTRSWKKSNPEEGTSEGGAHPTKPNAASSTIPRRRSACLERWPCPLSRVCCNTRPSSCLVSRRMVPWYSLHGHTCSAYLPCVVGSQDQATG